MLDWLLHPLAGYAFTAALAGLSLWLFLSVKLERSGSAGAAQKRVRTLEEAVEELRRRMERMELDMQREREAATEAVRASSSPDVPPGDLNLTRRSQALRLARRGESPEKIAAALGIPLTEVDLLLKVQEIITSNLK